MTTAATHSLHDLLRARYGGAAPLPPDGIPAAAIPDGAEPLLATLLGHRSVRRFSHAALPAGTLELLVAAAQSAATSSNLQTWSVVAVEDPQRKAAAATLAADQAFIRQAPLFLVFCADLSRLTFASGQAGLPGEGLDYLEMFLMAALDATLAAQNTVVAAEALGLGICYVGAARNRPQELAELLGLPPRVVGVFGLAVGWPAADDTSAVKPRLAQAEVLHRETYRTEQRPAAIAAYNTAMRAFYAGQKMDVPGDWSQHAAKRIATVETLRGRHLLRGILNQRGFGLK